MSATEQSRLTRLQVRTLGRAYAVDEDTVAPAASDPQWNTLIDDVYSRLHVFLIPRLQVLTAAQALGYPNPITGPIAANGPLYMASYVGIKSWDRLFIATTGTGLPSFGGATELERQQPHRILWLQANRPQTSDTTPKMYSLEEADTSSGSGASVPTFQLRLWPQCAAGTFYISAYGTLAPPAALTNDGDYLNGLDTEGARWVARIAAAIMVGRMGKSQEAVDALWRLVPPRVVSEFNPVSDPTMPNARPGEARN